MNVEEINIGPSDAIAPVDSVAALAGTHCRSSAQMTQAAGGDGASG